MRKINDGIELTQNALQVLEKRALLKDKSGKVIETPSQLYKRIAKHVATIETKNKIEHEESFYKIMAEGKFLCGGTLLWAGMGKDTITSKCLVLPIEDSIESIFRTLNWNIQCLTKGVGTGFNFSKIRSSLASVSTTQEKASGPVEFIKLFNEAQDKIKGRGGRGLGSIAILNADHPDIEKFIELKKDLVSGSHYNISVGASDKFMKAVKNNSAWELVDPHDKTITKTVNARELFDKIALNAWKSGDPGFFFLDTVEKGNTTPTLGKMDAPNVCGEQPLLPFETCNMGHLDISKFVKGFPLIEQKGLENKTTSKKAEYINWDELEKTITIAVRFLDNTIDINNYVIPEISGMTKKTRNIGLGIMGFADTLIKLGIPYGSEDSIAMAVKIMEFIQRNAHKTSHDLGAEKGDFPAIKESVWSGKKHMRNTRLTTIAPTGTISIIANCNPGIEPVFALGYIRKNSMGNVTQEVIEPLFEKALKTLKLYSKDLVDEICSGKSLSHIAKEFNIPKRLSDVFITSHEIDPSNQVKIQAAFQKYTDSAVSKTINLPNNAKWEDVANIYLLAHNLGCKGITVFRDGCKDQVLSVGTNKSSSTSELIKEAEPRERDFCTSGNTYKVNTEQGSLFLTINSDTKGIFEVFLNIGKSGSFTRGYTEAIGRLISVALRSGVKLEVLIEQLQGIRTSTATFNKGMVVYSVPDAVAKILKLHLGKTKAPTLFPQVEIEQHKLEIEEKYTKKNLNGDLLECPECDGDLVYAEGCIFCPTCGYSKCG